MNNMIQLLFVLFICPALILLGIMIFVSNCFSAIWNKIIKKIMFKKLLIILILFSLSGCGSVDLGAKDKFKKEKLKADKHKILNAKSKNVIEEELDENGNPTGGFINKGKIKTYDYISDIKANEQKKFFKDGERYSNIKNEYIETKLLGASSDTIATTVEFWFYDKYYLDDDGEVYEIILNATTTEENFEYQTATTTAELILSFFGIKGANATVEDYYVGSGDGGILAYQTETTPSQALWDGLHDWDGSAATVTGIVSHTSTYDQVYVPRLWVKAGTNSMQIGHSFFPANTAALPDSATISSAHLYIRFLDSNAANIDVGVVGATQASYTAVAVTDFDLCGDINDPTELSNRATVTSTAGQKDFTLNADGLAWINKTGYTSFGVRPDDDLDDVYTGAQITALPSPFYSEYDGTAICGSATCTDPYLSVTYTDAGGAVTATPKSSIIIFE